MTHTIDIRIKKGGDIAYEVMGIKGPDCQKVTDFIDKLGEVTANRQTQEYHECEPVVRTIRTSNGD